MSEPSAFICCVFTIYVRLTTNSTGIADQDQRRGRASVLDGECFWRKAGES